MQIPAVHAPRCLRTHTNLHLCELSFRSLLLKSKERFYYSKKAYLKMYNCLALFPHFLVRNSQTKNAFGTLSEIFLQDRNGGYEGIKCVRIDNFSTQTTWHWILKPQGAGSILKFARVNTTQFNTRHYNEVIWCTSPEMQGSGAENPHEEGKT